MQCLLIGKSKNKKIKKNAEIVKVSICKQLLLHLARAIFNCLEWSVHPSVWAYGKARTGEGRFVFWLGLLGSPSTGASSLATLVHKEMLLLATLNSDLLSNKLIGF